MQPFPSQSTGESNMILSIKMQGSLPCVSPVKLVEEGSLVFIACVIVVLEEAVMVMGAAMDEALDELEEDERV